jgi:hypothetical protein
VGELGGCRGIRRKDAALNGLQVQGRERLDKGARSVFKQKRGGLGAQ